MISSGSQLTVDRDNDKNPVVALREIAETAISPEDLREELVHSLQKYVEVVGIRMITDNKRPVAKFVVINHSGTEIDGLVANVTLWASTSRSEEDSVGSFNFRIDTIGPDESKELTEPLKTKLKMYELPDWQNATAEIQITAPQAP